MEFILKEKGKPDHLVMSNMFQKQMESEFKRFCTDGRGRSFDEYLKGTGYYISDVSPTLVIDLDELKESVLKEYREDIRRLDEERPGFAKMMKSMNGIEV